MQYLGDFNTGESVDVRFPTFGASNESITITGLAITDVEIYPFGSITQRASDNGIALLDTDGIDVDGITGIHGFTIDLSDNSDAGFYAAGTRYWVVLSAITVNGQTVNTVLGWFSIGCTLRPTTAGRTLDVSAGGEAGIDWANVGSPTSTVNLSGTTVKTATDVETDTADIQSRLPAALTADGNIKADTLRVGGTLQTAGDLAVLLADIPTVAEFNARTLVAASYATAANQTSIEGKIDTIDGLIDTHNAIWTSTRAGYLDNANVGGLLASQADVQAITQAQRVRISLPNLIERPDAGSTAYRIWIYVYNELHQAEDLDSNPTVTAENNAGTDRSTNLGTVTKPTGTGIYYVDYTVASGHAIEGLIVKVAATEGAVTTNYAAAAMVVDTTAVDFTSADRAKLDALHDTRLTADRAGYIDNLSAGAVAQSSELAKVPKSDGTVSWNATALAAILAQAASALSTYDAPTRAELTSDINSVLTRLGTPAGASVSADIAAIDALIDAIKLVTDQIPDGGALTALLASIAAILDDTGTNGVVVASASKSGYALTSGERDSIATALLDLASAIDGKTLRQALRYIAAMVAGKVSGAGSGTETFKGLDGVTDRVEITADASGNRTAASYDP